MVHNLVAEPGMGYAMTGHDDGKNVAVSTYIFCYKSGKYPSCRRTNFPAMIQQMTMILPAKDRSEKDGENPMGYKRQ